MQCFYSFYSVTGEIEQGSHLMRFSYSKIQHTVTTFYLFLAPLHNNAIFWKEKLLLHLMVKNDASNVLTTISIHPISQWGHDIINIPKHPLHRYACILLADSLFTPTQTACNNLKFTSSFFMCERKYTKWGWKLHLQTFAHLVISGSVRHI